MQGVQPAVLISINVVSLTIDLESRVLNPVGVAAGHTTQVRVLLVDLVVAGIVETKDNVADFAVDVLDEEVADGGTIGDEVGADSLAGDRVLAVLVDTSAVAGDLGLGEGEEREGRESSEACKHCCGVVLFGSV